MDPANHEKALQDKAGFNRFTQSDFVRQQHSRYLSRGDLVQDVELVRNQIESTAQKSTHIGLPETSLFLVYLTGGVVTIFTGPLIGRLADRHGRFRVYVCLIAGACVVIRLLTSSGPLPLWQTLLLAAFFFTFASGRFVPGQAVISMAVPSNRRGAYMSLVACSRDLAAGLTSFVGGRIVAETADGRLLNFDRLGLLAIGASLVSLWIFRQVKSAE